MPCRFLHALFVLFKRCVITLKEKVQHTVHRKIGIAAYRRCKMQIFRRRKPEMPHVFAVIARLFHTAQQHSGNQPFLLRALHARKQRAAIL